MLMLLTAKFTSLTNLSPLFVRRLIRVEKYISCTSGREMEFKTKYIVYLSVVSVKRVLPVHVFCVGFIRQTAHVSQLFLFKSPHDIRIQWREKVTIFDQRCFTSAAISGFFDTKEENLGVEIESKTFYRRNKCRCRFCYLVLFLSLFLRGDRIAGDKRSPQS